jgi:WD40 repeat protein
MWDESSAISASADRTIRFWDIKDESNHKYLKGHGAGIT